MAVRSPHLHLTLRAFLPRRVRLPRPRARGGRRAAVRVRGARPARRAGAVRVPAARALLRRVARERAREARRRADRARRAAARARGRDLRPRARRAEADRGAGALPHRAPLAPDLDGGVLRRLRLGRPRLRARLRRARALALRRLSTRTRPSRRSSASRSSRRSSSAAGSGSGPPPRASSPHHWPEAQGLLAAGLRPRGRPLLRARARAWPRAGRGAARRAGRARRRRHRDPARHRRARSLPGRCSSSGSTGGRSGSGRCCRSRRRSRRASRRGSTRSAPRCERCARRGSLSPTPTRRSPRRSTAGSSRSSRTSPSAPSSCAAPWPALLGETWALRAAVLLGEGPRASGARCTRRCRALAAGSRRPRAAADAVRRSLVETLRHGDRAALVALARRRAPRPALRGRRVDAPNSLIRDEAVSVSSQERR